MFTIKIACFYRDYAGKRKPRLLPVECEDDRCHTVRGLDDKSIDRSGVDLGPDLTHLSSRLTIAGASLTQNEGNLAGWIVDAQHVKPGNLMPNMSVNSQDLQALLAYLGTLRQPR